MKILIYVINRIGIMLVLLVLLIPINSSAKYYMRANQIQWQGNDVSCGHLLEHSIGDYINDHQDTIEYYSLPDYEHDGFYRFNLSRELPTDLDLFEDKGNYYIRNINSMKGLDQLENIDKIDSLQLSTSCISGIEGLESVPNLRSLMIGYANITNLDGLENLNELEYLFLAGNQIETIENIEDIRKDTSKPLEIVMSGDYVKYITKDSYNYIMDPTNNVQFYFRFETNSLSELNTYMNENGELPADGKYYEDITIIE